MLINNLQTRACSVEIRNNSIYTPFFIKNMHNRIYNTNCNKNTIPIKVRTLYTQLTCASQIITKQKILEICTQNNLRLSLNYFTIT